MARFRARCWVAYLGHQFEVSLRQFIVGRIVQVPQVVGGEVEAEHGGHGWEELVLLRLVVKNLRLGFSAEMLGAVKHFVQIVRRVAIR